MEINRLLKFFFEIIFKGWGVFGIANACTIVGFIFMPYLNAKWNYSNTIGIFFCIIVISFVAKLIKQSFGYYSSYFGHIRIKSIVTGDGAYKGYSVIALERSNLVQKDTLLTLYSGSTGIKQPVCILKVISAEYDEQILAIQLMPTEQELNISTFFSEAVRLKSLYALPIIDYTQLNEFINGEAVLNG